MIIQDISVAVRYKRVESIKKLYFLNESHLDKEFAEAEVLPIPEEAPVDIPRIVVKTINGHSQLAISPIRSTLNIKFNDGFETDWNRCKDYLANRMKKVFALLNEMTKNEYEYIGVIATILFDDKLENEEGAEVGAEFIKKHLLKSNALHGIYDMNVKYTFVENQNMFVNIVLQNARVYDQSANPDLPGMLKRENQLTETIGAVIDINDRYGFNNIDGYCTDCTKLDELIAKLSEIIGGKLDTLLEQGVY